jgi:Fe-S oxidoreductase
LSSSDLGVVGMAQHFETASTCGIGLQVVMAPWSVTFAIAGFDVVDLTVAPCCGAIGTNAVVFGSAFC